MTMKTKTILALVVSSSGTLQSGLLALMTTIAPIGTVLVAEEAVSALRLVENHHPALVIVDMALGGVHRLIRKIKTQRPQAHLIVIADDMTQQAEAEEAGADRVLFKGFSAQKFIAVVENLPPC